MTTSTRPTAGGPGQRVWWTRRWRADGPDGRSTATLLFALGLAACVTPDEEVGSAAGRLVELFAVADTGVTDLSPYVNLGGARTVQVNEDSILVRFDDAALVDAVRGDELASATLVLSLDGSCVPPSTVYRAYRMTATWDEGGGGAFTPSSLPGATALCAVDLDPRNALNDCAPGTQWALYPDDAPAGWATPERTPPYVEPSTATGICAPESGTPGPAALSFDVTADVRAFLDGSASDHGWAGPRNYFGPHGGIPHTPGHWHWTYIPGPRNPTWW